MFLIFFILLATNVFGYSGSDFLLINNSAESSGAGGGGTAKYSDISFSLINPASPLKYQFPQILVSHLILNENLNYEYFGVGVPINNLMLSLHFIYLYLPDTWESVYGEQTGNTINYYDTSFIFSGAIKIKEIVNLGINLKYIKREIAEYKATAWAADMGIIKDFYFFNFDKNTDDNLSIGFALKNIGTKLKFIKAEERLPLTFSFGITYSPYKWFSIFYDLNKTINKNYFHYTGLEYKKFYYFIPRIGLHIEKEAILLAGFGINYKIKYVDLHANYSVNIWGKAIKSHSFSLNLTFKPVIKTLVKTNKVVHEKIVEKPVYVPVVINSNKAIEKVAVLPFENTSRLSDLDYLIKTIPESIASFLAKQRTIEVIDISAIESKLHSLSVKMEDFNSPDGVILLGKILNVDHIIKGNFVEVGNKIRINVNLIKIKTGVIVTSEQVEGDVEKDLFLLLDRASSNILSYMRKD